MKERESHSCADAFKPSSDRTCKAIFLCRREKREKHQHIYVYKYPIRKHICIHYYYTYYIIKK